MKVWRLQKNTDGGDIAELCLNENVIAMGWALDENDRKEYRRNPTFDRYCELALHHYTRKNYSPVIRLAEETEPNDIVWMRHKGEYFFARIREDSDWLFDSSEGAVDTDTTNRRINIKWHKAGDESSVPGCLTTGFIRGTTYQQIKKQGIVEYSQMLYNMLASEKEGFKYPKPELSLKERDFWNLLQPSDAEDLLCMWLYKTKGYVVIPSTNKISTELYECVLVDPNSDEYRHIYIQVKKGDVDINAANYSDLDGDVYFLSTEGKVKNADGNKNYFIVNPTSIFEFAIDPSNRSIIPEGITRWIRFLTEAENENMDISATKGIMLDTNLSYSETNEMEMLTQNRVCAYGDAERYIRSFKKGDYALFYSKGRGIIAIGEVTSEKPGQVETERGLYHDVKMIVPADGDYDAIHSKYISAKEIKEILNRGFYFASTIKTPFLNRKQVDMLIDALKEKYNK